MSFGPTIGSRAGRRKAVAAAVVDPTLAAVKYRFFDGIGLNIGSRAGRRKFAGPAGAAGPGGRLSLTTGVPVQTADVSGGTSIFYLPYVSNALPAPLAGFTIPDAGITLALDSTNTDTGFQASGSLYDLFVFSDSGTLRLGTGPAWTSTSARGTGAGTTELQFLSGVRTNKNSMTARWGSATGNTSTVAVGQGVYVGTMRASANGQCTHQFSPAAANGGSNTFLGLYNAYNQVFVSARSREATTGGWTYASTTWRNANGSANNRVSWVDGLGFGQARGEYISNTISGVSGDASYGVNWNTTATLPILRGDMEYNSAAIASSTTPFDRVSAVLGINFCQATESSPAATTSTFFGGSQLQSVQIELMM